MEKTGILESGHPEEPEVTKDLLYFFVEPATVQQILRPGGGLRMTGRERWRGIKGPL